MRVGTATATLIPSSAKLLSSKNTFIGGDASKAQVRLHVEDTFDFDGDGKADLQRRRVLVGGPRLLDGDLLSGGKLESERFTFTSPTQRITAEDSSGSGRISSVLTIDLKAFTVSGEKDLNGDFTVDKKVELGADRKLRITSSSKNDGVFDVTESPNGGFGW